MKRFALALFFPALAISTQFVAGQVKPAATSQPAVAPSSASAGAILEAGRDQNGLDGKDLKPWHLKARYESFGPKGAPSDSGTFEEWWVAPDRYKRSYTSAQFTQAEYRTPEGLFTNGATGSAHWPESLIGDHILSPLPAQQDIDDSAPEKRKQNFGEVPLECVMLTQKIPRLSYAPLGLFPTYCFSPDQPTLRFSNYYGRVQIIFNKMGLFEGRYIGLDTTINDGAAELLHLQIDQLSEISDSVAAAAVRPPTGAVKHSHPSVDVPASVMAGSLIEKSFPAYPLQAKQNRVSGTVELPVTISRDGHIRKVRAAKSPDPDLALAAIAAVERWVYKPYLLDGEPVEVNTTIQINFMLGR